MEYKKIKELVVGDNIWFGGIAPDGRPYIKSYELKKIQVETLGFVGFVTFEISNGYPEDIKKKYPGLDFNNLYQVDGNKSIVIYSSKNFISSTKEELKSKLENILENSIKYHENFAKVRKKYLDEFKKLKDE